MLDSRFRAHFGDTLEDAGKRLAALPFSANQWTLTGLAMGLVACASIAVESYAWGLFFLLLSRLIDGLDGAVARARGEVSAFGGYLDSVADYLFYGLVPLAFALADPSNAIWAALLLASYAGTASSFLGFAVIAAARGLETDAQGKKSFYYMAGLAEGTETILCYVFFCLWPMHFAPIAAIFATMCFITTAGRVLNVRRLLADLDSPPSETTES